MKKFDYEKSIMRSIIEYMKRENLSADDIDEIRELTAEDVQHCISDRTDIKLLVLENLDIFFVALKYSPGQVKRIMQKGFYRMDEEIRDYLFSSVLKIFIGKLGSGLSIDEIQADVTEEKDAIRSLPQFDYESFVREKIKEYIQSNMEELKQIGDAGRIEIDILEKFSLEFLCLSPDRAIERVSKNLSLFVEALERDLLGIHLTEREKTKVWEVFIDDSTFKAPVAWMDECIQAHMVESLIPSVVEEFFGNEE